MNAFLPTAQPSTDASVQRLFRFAEVCRRVGLPPVTISPRCANKILPNGVDDRPTDDHTLHDLIWSLRGAIQGLTPCVRTAGHEQVIYRIKFWAKTNGDAPQSQHVAAVVETNRTGQQWLRLVLPEELTTVPERNNTILLVEDDPGVAELEQLLLEAAGYRVQWTADGLEGLQLAQAERPAAVVLDADLPGMDGFEICRQLKANSMTSSLPILFCSGNPHAPHLAIALGADKVLSKPHGISQLASCLGQMLGR